MLTFQRFDPTPHGFPRPRVPLLAPVRLASLSVRGGQLQHGARWYRRGRYALREAYRLAGIAPGASLLAPAYHCRTMLDPAIALGGEIRLYAQREDLSPDLEALQALTTAAPVKALLLPHYFGFRQHLEPVAEFCHARGIALIEDCSHALFGREDAGWRSAGLGRTGHYAIASPYKFFSCLDGGLLWSNHRPLDQAAGPHPPLSEEARSAARLVLAATRRRHAPALPAPDADCGPPQMSAGPMRDDGCHASSTPSKLYEPGEEQHRSLATSRWIAGHTDLARLIRRRRAHYLRWLEAVAGLQGCKPLFANLPEDCVPYMFPLRIEQPLHRFPRLKHLGVPIWRWDDMARSECAVAQSYRLHLLHLPCHQELEETEMRWMTHVVATVCSAGTAGSGHVG